MRFLIIFIFSLPLLSGPKDWFNRASFNGLWHLLHIMVAQVPRWRSPPTNLPTPMFQNQRFTVIPNTGAGNDCFFLALQQAGIALTRELAVEILTVEKTDKNS